LLVDTHCHLNFNSFDKDRDSVLERARDAGIARILNPGIDLPSSYAAVKLAEDHDEVFAAIGVHPNDALSWDDTTCRELRNLAEHGKVAAIGEIGLDYYWMQAPAEMQQMIFQEQLEIAAQTGLPIVVHIRDANPEERRATEDALNILDAWQKELENDGNSLAATPGVLHSFNGSTIDADRAAKLNLYIGITGPVTFRKAVQLQQVVANVPVTHLLIETDAPFLTPHPYRGQRNEPAYVRYVAEKIAQIKDYTYEEICEVTTNNAGRLFHW